ncbi:3-oxoacyl-[acyl-carrier protein] reductase [Rhodoligotrophos appendicifer]|uniref:SDR family oxidoreductase n=1 Tax=Rhodoligotrophos appendicifer TaxID=987056 RepID=UPI0011868871|nr:SDR family oxidoreductase [Rhodoligotrophos appendicifer]
MNLGISGRRAIICASSRGLGRGCATALARAGVDVVINGRDEATLARTATEIREQTGVSVIPVVADISTQEGQVALLDACPEPDILVTNNGGPPLRDFRDLHRDEIIQGVIQNMVTPIEIIQKVVDPMMRREFGRIVNITSSSVKAPITGLDLSSGARAGLTAFLAGVARSVAHRNVTINAIQPGAFDTDRLAVTFKRFAVADRSEEELRAERAKAIPAGRFGTTDEFGELCAFLCSIHAGYITGQSLLIDGGAVNAAF